MTDWTDADWHAWREHADRIKARKWDKPKPKKETK